MFCESNLVGRVVRLTRAILTQPLQGYVTRQYYNAADRWTLGTSPGVTLGEVSVGLGKAEGQDLGWQSME